MKRTFNKKWVRILMLLTFIGCVGYASVTMAQTDAVKPYISAVEEAKEGMTLWQLIKSGGFIMVVLALLSVFTVYLIVYHFMSLKEEIIIPEKFTEEALDAIEKSDNKKLQDLVKAETNVASKILIDGFKKKGRGSIFVKEDLEIAMRKQVAKLWQNLSYLADVANISPLIGLLGTVLGMIQAFNVIAFQSGVVKPILLAGGVSKAMVTTAGGLIIAIPAFIFYSYFRARVQDITDAIESFTDDVIKLTETK